MKRLKKIGILLGILGVLCLVTVIVMHTEEKKEEIKNTDQSILKVDSDSVKSLSWEYDQVSLSFTKQDQWTYDSDDEFPVSEEKIKSLLADFADFGADFVIEDVEDYGQYGLDKPTCTIRFATDDKEYEVKLGDTSTMDSQRYVSVGDGNVYLVDSDPYEDFKIELKDMIQNDSLPTSIDHISDMEVSGVEDYTVLYQLDSTDSPCSDDIYFVKKDGSNVALDTDRVKDYCSGVIGLELSDYASYKVTEEELSDWGLKTPELTVTLNYVTKDEDDQETTDTLTLSLGRNQEELAKKLKAEKKNKEYSGTVTCYVRVGDSRIIYKITEEEYDKLMAASFNDLRHKDVMTADWDTITKIDVTLDGETYSITPKVNEDSEDQDNPDYIFTYDGEEFEDSELKTRVDALFISDFKEVDPDKKQEISMTFHLNQENFSEIRVDIYRYDKESCLLVLDGKSLGLISRSSAVDLMEAINEMVL